MRFHLNIDVILGILRILAIVLVVYLVWTLFSENVP